MHYIEPAVQSVIELRNWSDFEDKLEWLESQVVTEGPIDQRFEYPIFRGQGHHLNSWNLDTTLERLAIKNNEPTALGLLAYYDKISRCKPTLESLTGQRWPEVPDYPSFKSRLEQDPYRWLDSFFNSQAAVYEYLVYLRHHGFPSPLLDWSASPFIAAFFAVDEIDLKADHVCVFAFLRKGLHSGGSDEHFFTVGPYMRTDRRHYLQQSRYSMCVQAAGTDYSFIPHSRVLVEKNGEQGKLFELRLPVSEAASALRKLELMNINSYSLLGTEDALVKTMAQREYSPRK